MKALEILNELANGEKVTDFGYIDEAIAELEALQAPKTCDGCKWSNKNECHNDAMESVVYGDFYRFQIPIKDFFFCAYYEPKETK